MGDIAYRRRIRSRPRTSQGPSGHLKSRGELVFGMDKSVKYDRQLRLWAANGQEALEKSRICLINGTATGAETLKNLVLPGLYIIYRTSEQPP